MLKVSIIVPTFNSAATLDNTLDSFRRQNWPELEVIVVDGSSTDGTQVKVEASTDIVTNYISEPDMGIYDAINKGVAMASGKLIGVVGSDDSLCDGAIAAIVACWVEFKPDIIAGRSILVSSGGREAVRADEHYGVGALLSGIPFCHNAMFATPEAYDCVGGYDLKYKICADAHWVHRAIRKGLTCQLVDLPIVRFSMNGLSSNEAERIMKETYEVISGNFSGLSVFDAEVLFRAIRGWSNGADVELVLHKNRGNPEVLLSAAAAFLNKSRSLKSVDSGATCDETKDILSINFSRVIRRIKKIFL